METHSRVTVHIPKLMKGSTAREADLSTLLAGLAGLEPRGGNAFGSCGRAVSGFDLLISAVEDIAAPVLVLETLESGTAEGWQVVTLDLATIAQETVSDLSVEHARDTLEFAEILARLGGHLTALDHIGVNFNVGWLGSFPFRHRLLTNLAATDFAISHPGRPDWIFLVPDADEIAFGSGHALPKVELVLEPLSFRGSILQLDVCTDLSCEAVEQLFPAPYGMAPEGLATYLRSVFVRTSWPDGVALRLDIRFAQSNGADFSRWLVSQGQRLRLWDLQMQQMVW